MTETATIRRALLSVSNKEGIVELAQFLAGRKIELISTGGTARTLREAGINVRDVSDVTGFPEVMDGRVKTLHPHIHGGILAVRDNKEHQKAMEKHEIDPIDLVVINLYPFEETRKSGADYHSCVENIDIGGPAMVRASAKNHAHVAILTSPDQYKAAQKAIEKEDVIPLTMRRDLARQAFAHTARYDGMIANWLAEEQNQPFPETFLLSATRQQVLRYGENPHQQAALYITNNAISGVANAKQLHGKELSYNNIADTDAAFTLVSEFSAPTAAIIKHANPCGVASHADITAAYDAALACDPVSAFGGIFAFNVPVSKALAEKIGELFAEVVIAPSFDKEALNILTKKKNIRLLKTGNMPQSGNQIMIKTVTGGLLVQSEDQNILDEKTLKVVTKRAPTEQEMADLRFAFTVAKHVKSNAIVYAKDGATVGVGAGQMSRVDSARIGAWKAKETATSVKSAEGSVLASDAFFPFADGLISAAEHGITAVIQPGGSVRDEEVIAAADERNIAMVMTGIRHFRH